MKHYSLRSRTFFSNIVKIFIILSLFFTAIFPGSTVTARPATQNQTEISVTKTDLLEIDANNNNRPDPGDTLKYEILVSNDGMMDLNGVSILDSLAEALTLVPNSLETTPLAYPQTFTIAEDSPVDITLTGFDADGDPLIITRETDPENGNITGTVPDLTYTPALNFSGSDFFTFKVCDDFVPTPNCDESTILINIGGENDAPIVEAATFDLDENSTNGTSVGFVNFTDAESGQNHTFSITSGNTDGAFEIDPVSGEIKVANSMALDFEMSPSYVLRVSVTDDGIPPLSGEADIEITLNDRNEAPQISPQTFAIDENLPTGTIVGTVVASDPDTGQLLTYVILSGNTDGAFQINTATGEITILSSTPLDFDVNPVFTLLIQVTDDATPALTDNAIITINLNQVNVAPVIDLSTFSVNENSSLGSVVGTVTFTDSNANQNHSFQITSGNSAGGFSINNTTGQINVNNSGVLDFETTPTFSLTVEVSDDGTPPLSDSEVIIINLVDQNEAPEIADQTFSIDENSLVGTVVGSVVANDPDAGQNLAYSILSGNTDGAFQINTATGEITVLSSTPLDFDVNPVFSLSIQVEDDATPALTADALITINLNQINVAPVVDQNTFSVNENSSVGSAVGTVTFTDLNANQNHLFQITSGNSAGGFSINSTTGQITVNNSSVLDFETTPTFSLTVEVTDDGTPSLSDSEVIIVNLIDQNESPEISDQNFGVNENSPVGTLVGTVVAINPDSGQTLNFEILTGNIGGVFEIDPVTGVITVLDPTTLDFEETSIYNLTVQVTDDGLPALSASATITIDVYGLNDAPSISSATFTLDENSLSSTIVGTVVASDPDLGQTLTFAIISGDPAGTFSIHAQTGAITVNDAAALDYETFPAFNLTVQVTDDGAPILSSSATITINLNDINESPNVLDDTFSIEENAINGSLVGTVSASDPDAGQILTFSILSGDSSGIFSIDSTSGQISIANGSLLDYESGTTIYPLIVQVTDNGAGLLSDSATITIQVLDVNELPQISPQIFSLDENSPNATEVGTVIATDSDAGQAISFSIISGNFMSAFVIDAITGMISVSNSLVVDYETLPVFNLVVRVTDNGSPSLYSEAAITINLNDINDAPVANNDYYETIGNTLLEVSAANSSVFPHIFVSGSVLSNDTDVENNIPLIATIDTITAGAVVDLNSDGTFTYSPPPGLAGEDTFTYTVTDSGGASSTGTAIIRMQGMVWYVNNTAASDGTGRSDDPYHDLLAAQTLSVAWDVIFVYFGDGTNTGQNSGFVLKANQKLFGQSVGLSLPLPINGSPSPTVLVPAVGSNPKIGNASGYGITLAANNTIQGFEISSQGGVGVFGTNIGDFTFGSSSISTTGVGALNLTNGAVSIDLTALNSSGSTSTGLNLNTITGTVAIDSGSLANSNGALVNISGGTVSLDFKASLSQANNFPLINIVNHATGTISFSERTLSATNGTGLQFSNADGTYIFSDQLTLNGGDAGIDILAGSAGTITFDDNTSITNPIGVAFLVQNSTPTITYSGSISDNTGYLLDVDNMDGGTLTFQTGNLTSTASGVRILNSNGAIFNFNNPTKSFSTSSNNAITLTNNSSSTFSFKTGTLTINTTSGRGIDAGNGGTIEILGSNNTITSTTGIALRVDGVVFSPDGLSFSRISSNGAYNGIYLKNTGNVGRFVVSGTGSSGSGGTIQNSTDTGIYLESTFNPSLLWMTVSSNSKHGIHVNNVAGLTLDHLSVNQNGNAIGENGIHIQQPSGIYAITNSTITNSFEHNIYVTGTSGIVTGFSVTGNSAISHAALTSATDRNGINIFLPLGSTLRFNQITIQNNAISGNDTGVRIITDGTATVDRVDIANNTLNANSFGVSLGAHSNSTLNYRIASNTFSNGTYTQIVSNVYDSAIADGLVSLNSVALTANSGFTFGMAFSQIKSSRQVVNVSSNTVTGFGDSGIFLSTQASSGIGTGQLHATVSNNNISTVMNTALGALYIQSGSSGSGTETNILCANVHGNTFNGGSGVTGFGFPVDVALDYMTASTTIQLEGNSNPSDPVPYFTTNNTITHGAAAILESNNAAVYPSAVCSTTAIASIPNELDNFVKLGNSKNESETKLAGKVRLSPTPAAETIALDLGLIPAGKFIKITFLAVIANPLSSGNTRISNQAFVSGLNFATVASDDPDTVDLDDPTITMVSLPEVQPETGFAPNRLTNLPVQNKKTAFQDMGSIWLEIPSQNLKASIVGVPLTDQGWQIDWLNKEIGYLQGTAFPTNNGNSVLTAHVYDAFGNPGPFVNLGKLIWGRQIIVHAFGSKYIYEVRSTQWFVNPDDTTSFKHEEKPWLTLITCRGYNEKSDTYKWRTVVRAVLIKVVLE